MNRQKTTKMKQKVPVPFVSFLLDLIYPPKCGICGKLNDNFLCRKCYKMLENDAKFSIEKSTNSENEFDKHLYIFINFLNLFINSYILSNNYSKRQAHTESNKH